MSALSMELNAKKRWRYALIMKNISVDLTAVCVKFDYVLASLVCSSSVFSTLVPSTEPELDIIACVEYHFISHHINSFFFYCVGRNCPATAQTVPRLGFGKVVQGDCISRVVKIRDHLTPIRYQISWKRIYSKGLRLGLFPLHCDHRAFLIAGRADRWRKLNLRNCVLRACIAYRDRATVLPYCGHGVPIQSDHLVQL